VLSAGLVTAGLVWWPVWREACWRLSARQGWGNLVNTAVICILLAGFGQTTREYNRGALAAVWRLSFAAGLAPLAGMAAYRLLCARESALWERRGERQEARRRSGPAVRMRPRLATAHGAHVPVAGPSSGRRRRRRSRNRHIAEACRRAGGVARARAAGAALLAPPARHRRRLVPLVRWRRAQGRTAGLMPCSGYSYMQSPWGAESSQAVLHITLPTANTAVLVCPCAVVVDISGFHAIGQ
jgi:hypothetical protein